MFLEAAQVAEGPAEVKAPDGPPGEIRRNRSWVTRGIDEEQCRGKQSGQTGALKSVLNLTKSLLLDRSRMKNT